MVEVVFTNADSYAPIKDMAKVDMHCHTNISDGMNNPADVIKMAKKLKIGISITDHNAIEASLMACRELPFAIPGVEITSSDAIDFLAYFYDTGSMEEFYNKHIKGHHLSTRVFNLRKLNWSSEELLSDLKKHNCIVVLPHPMTVRPKNSFTFMNNHPKLLRYIHGIEAINSVMSQEANEKAVLWAKELDKGVTGASDAHDLVYLGKALTASNAENIDEFLDNIAKKKNIAVGTSISGFSKLHHSLRILSRNLSW